MLYVQLPERTSGLLPFMRHMSPYQGDRMRQDRPHCADGAWFSAFKGKGVSLGVDSSTTQRPNEENTDLGTPEKNIRQNLIRLDSRLYRLDWVNGY